MAKTILIAEDHAILREGLFSLLSTEPEVKIIGEVGDGLAAIRSAREHTPDLLLVDLSMPKMNGTAVIREIKKVSPETKILVLTMHRSEEHVFSALQAGANGYVLKDTKHSELLKAIRKVLNGKQYLSPEVARLVESCAGQKKEFVGGLDLLTPREREVLQLVAEGHTNRKVAELLYISPKTVDKHRTNLMQKINAHSVQDLTRFAVRCGLMSDE